MADDFQVNGADRLLKLSKTLKAMGETELRKQLNKDIKLAAKPLLPKVKRSARDNLPQRGGLAADISRQLARIRVATGKDPGVSVIMGKKSKLAIATTNKGFVRHPVFNVENTSGKRIFVRQEIPKATGWFDDELRREAPGVLPDVERALQGIADRIGREGF